MSNPDFPGSSWQDRSEFPGQPPSQYGSGRDGDFGWAGEVGSPEVGGRAGGYPPDAGYGSPAGAAGGAGYGSPLDGSGQPGASPGTSYGSNGNGHSGRNGNAPGFQGRDRQAGGYQAGGGYQANGGYQAGGGYQGSSRGGEPSYNDGRGYDGGYGGGYDNHGSNGYDQRRGDDSGYGGDGGYAGRGGPADGGPDVLVGDPAGAGYGDIGRGHAKGYRGARSRRRRGAAVPAGPDGSYGPGGSVGIYGPDGPGGPGGPYGLHGPGGPYGPRGPGGPRKRGSGRGRGYGRGPQGLVGPRRNLLQRLWHGRWWRHWSIKKVALLTGAIAAGTVLVLIAGFFYVYSTVQLPIAALSSPLSQSSVVYFSDGHTEVGCFCAVNRTVLTSARLAQDPYLEEAFFAAEDRNYLHEGGISITGTARAILVDLSGGGIQGGSTITEQFVKTYFDPNGTGNLTYTEKLKEIIDAIKLAKLESKTWILTHYLNAIYLGSGAYGVEAAAETYFGKHAWQLSIAQCAMLAAMVQAPSAFDPSHPTQVVGYLGYSLLDRWMNEVLPNMARDNPGITQQQESALAGSRQVAVKNFPKIIPPSQAGSNWTGYRGYIMAAVQNELVSTYGYNANDIPKDGLQIVTTISKRKMDALYSAVKDAKGMMRQYGQALPIYAHIGAILENPKNGAIEAMYGGPDYTAPAKYCKKIYCTYNMATQSRNQVGSSFKPYVLATAVLQGMNVQTSILNGYSPLCVPPETMPTTESKRGPASSCPQDGVGWLPVGYDPVVEGPVPVAKAAALSSNAAFEDLAHRVGTTPIIRLAQQFGVDISSAGSPNYGSGLQDDVGKIGIALGIAPLTVEEQATTFATLADNGIFHTPHLIAKITVAGQSAGGQPVPLRVQSHPVLNPAQAADVNWALSFDTVYGTGVPNAILSPPRPTIAKTGTTDVAQSAFFIGALPQQYSFAVGMFTNSQNNTKGGQTLDILPTVGGTGGGFGGAWPATIWRLYMTKLLAMSPKPITQLAPLNLAGFQKWVQAKATKKKPKPCKGGGPGNGRGHGHGAGLGGRPCPNPSPTPSGTPTPTPTPTPTSSGTPTPTPTPPGAPARQPGPSRMPGPRSARTPSLTTAATPPRPAPRRPGWAVTTGLV